MSSESLQSRVGPGSSAETPPVADREGEWQHENPTPLLETLGDEYARAAFGAVLDRARSGREVAAATDMSRPTAFRRLNVLVDLGLLETEHRIDAEEGHHHKEYRPVVDSFSVTIDEGEIEIVVESAHSTGTPFDRPTAVPAND